MACLKVKGPLGTRVIPESADGNVRGKTRDEEIIDVVWECGPTLMGDASMEMEKVFTPEGIMVGNAIKKVTKVLHIKHCFKCSGRQRRYNQKGLEIQQKVKGWIVG